MSEIDFSAWEAPPPPEGLADAVIARMAEPEALPETAPRRRWVIAASAAAVLAIAGGIWAITRPHASAPTPSDHGEVIADKAQHVELGGASADLDRGADIRWHRTPHGLEVEQRAGAASWHVGKNEHMTIGAAVASIDAAGASLRVEVPMNLSDAKVIGASAVTAATVAMLTVVVYEGHVKVASSGQTVVVQPGTTYTLKQPPVVGVATVSDKPRVAVLALGATPAEVAVAKQLTAGLRARVQAGAYPFALAPVADKTLVELTTAHGCPIDKPACLTAIAGELDADILIYGHVDKQDAGFEVAIKRYDVTEAEVVREDVEMIPPGEADGPPLQGWANALAEHLLDAGLDATAKRSIAVLGLEGWNGDNVPHELVRDLRDRAKVGGGPFQLAPSSDKELVDEKLLHDCADEAPACMAAIGSDLGASALIYGSIRSQRVGYEITLKLFDVAHKRVERSLSQLIPAAEAQDPQLAGWAARLYNNVTGIDARPDSPDDAAVQQVLAGSSDELSACQTGGSVLGMSITPFGKVASISLDGSAAPPCISHVIEHLAFPASKHGGTFTRKLAKSGCDVDALIAEGNGYMTTRGDALKALAKYEAAIACKPEARTERLAFMAACNAANVTKAREHWDKLDGASQNQVVQMCIRNGITRDQLDTSCDADDIQNKGMSEEQVGQHAAALASFESAMRCKNANLPRLYQLSFMAACNAKSVSKSREYWGKLPPASAPMLKQMCVRNGISEDMLYGLPTVPNMTDHGMIRIDSVPPAKILLDGKDIGRGTPVVIEATPGKHKVTFVIGGTDRFTYPVNVKAGETETLSKDLQ